MAAVAAALLGSVACYFYMHRPSHESKPLGPYDASPLSFDGDSDQLRQTVIVPTLDSAIPEGKSVIWCASFQFAWNRLKDDLAREPVRLANAQAVADLLNQAGQTEGDVNPDAVYAAAGFAKDGIVKRIQEEMARKFPNVPTPQFVVPLDGAVAYAYLAASARYEYPFFENDEPFPFTDSAGKKTAVGSFGIRKKDDYAYWNLRDQVQILYSHRDGYREEIPDFVLDLCKTSDPYHIVVARLNRKTTLADTLADVERKIAPESKVEQLGPRDTVLVPNMAWKVTHHFKELEGKDKQFLNPALRGLYVDTAMQMVQFRLDRSGAELASEAKLTSKPAASYYHVNRPFLVYMKKRGDKQPFLVVWVENAELLQGRK
jgi:hypothetical protein